MIKKNQLLRNSERFLNVRPANNALLWGAPGAGKSSVIKATLNVFRPKNLRLITIQKNGLQDLPEIIVEVRKLSHKFIIHWDDASLEEH